jgi:fibronectin-binding autotransporter adhesin
VNQGIFAIETTSSILENANGDTITYNEGSTAQFYDLRGSITRPMIMNSAVTMGNASGQASTLMSNITLNGDLLFTNLNNSTGALTLLGNLTEAGGARSLTKIGPSTLVLAGTNTYTGLLFVMAGRLEIGNGGTTGTLGSGDLLNDATLAFNRSDSVAIANAIEGMGVVEKKGSGTTNLTGTSTYTGATNVVSGTLLVSGSVNGTASVNVAAGGTLGGSGSITTGAGNITLAQGGILAPGVEGAGTLVLDTGVGFLDVSGGLLAPGTFAFELGTTSDLVRLTSGTLSIGNGLLELDNFSFANAGGFGEGTYTLFATNAPILGTLGSSLTGAVLGLDATLAFSPDGTDLQLTVVPEPATAVSLLAGLGVLLGFRRGRRAH